MMRGLESELDRNLKEELIIQENQLVEKNLDTKQE